MTSLRFAPSTSVVDLIRKIYFTHPQRMVIKCAHGSQITVSDYDFRSFDVANGQRHRFSSSDERIVRAYSSLNNVLNIGIHYSQSQSLPSSLVGSNYVIPNNTVYPLFVFVHDIESQVEETTADVPTWLSAGATPSVFQSEKYVRLSQAAQFVIDAGLKYHWRSLNRVRYDNTDLASRLLIGYAWREIFQLSNDSDFNDYERLTVLIEDIHAQFGQQSEYMSNWFTSHDDVLWQSKVSNDSTGRQVWTSNILGKEGRLVYNILTRILLMVC